MGVETKKKEEIQPHIMRQRTFAIMFMIAVIELFSNIAVGAIKGRLFVVGNPKVPFRRIPHGKLAITSFVSGALIVDFDGRSISLEFFSVLDDGAVIVVAVVVVLIALVVSNVLLQQGFSHQLCHGGL